MPNILFFTDNKGFLEDIKEQVSLYANGFELYDDYDSEVIYDLVIMDEKPEILKYVHDNGFKIPVIYFKSNSDRNLSFAPTDIVIEKPFSLDIFLDLLKSSIYTFDNSSDGCINFNKYELWPAKKEIINERNGEAIKLTEKEVAILKYLYKAQNRIVSKNELLQEVWGYSPDSTTHTIETHIYRLRSKVEHDDESLQLIVTEDGGYKIVI